MCVSSLVYLRFVVLLYVRTRCRNISCVHYLLSLYPSLHVVFFTDFLGSTGNTFTQQSHCLRHCYCFLRCAISHFSALLNCHKGRYLVNYLSHVFSCLIVKIKIILYRSWGEGHHTCPICLMEFYQCTWKLFLFYSIYGCFFSFLSDYGFGSCRGVRIMCYIITSIFSYNSKYT